MTRPSTARARVAASTSNRRFSAIFAAVESIERRLLLSSDLPSRGQLEHMTDEQLYAAGVERLTWSGQTAYARAGEYLVKSYSDTTFGTKTQTLRRRMGDALGSKFEALSTLNGGDLYKVDAPELRSVDEFAALASRVKGFVRAEPNFIVWADESLPNDPSFSQLWGLHNTGQSGGKVDADIDAPEVWDQTTGNGSVVVGIIDTGVDYTHPDLAANMWINPGETAGNGLDDDANGIIDDVYGADFVGVGDGNPMDDHYHGTHVAGTIGAVGNNGVGVTGVAWNVKIMALKFLSASGSGSTDDAIEAINYASAMRTRGVNIRLTNNSWGGGAFSQLLLDAINLNATKDILFVAAAGNNSSNTDVSVNYPSGYNAPNILSIAALDRNDNLASFSNYGLTTVDLGAPGVDVYSTSPGNTYRLLSGTSMATPHVAGVAAMAYMVSPTSTYTRIRDVLMSSTVPVTSLAGKSVTGGRLNMLNALQQMGLQVTLTTPAPGSVASTPGTDFTVVSDADYDPASVSAADLTVNGIAASSVVLVDARTIRFEYVTSPVTAEGTQTVAMAADAIRRLSDSAASTALSSGFYYDPTPLVVSSSTPALLSMVPLPLSSITFDFSEAVDPTSVQASDLSIGFGTVSSVMVVDADTVTFALTGLSREGVLSLSIAPAAMRNTTGVPLAGLTSSVQLDAVALPLAPMVRSEPRGVLVHQTSASGSIAIDTDTDEHTLNIDAGQVLTAILAPGVALQGTIELIDPGGTVLATSQAAAPGDVVVLQGIPIATAGAYRIRVSSQNTTTGTYQLTAHLNTAVELESVGGAGNDTPATAQDLAVGQLNLGTGKRLAALGTAASSAVDWYRLDLAAGDLLSVLATNAAGLSLYDTSDTMIAQGSTTTSNAALRAFRAPTDGTYLLRVTGRGGAYQLEAGINLALDTGLAGQSLTGFGSAVGMTSAESLNRLFAFDNTGTRIREFNPTTGAIVREYASPVAASSDPDAGLATTGTTVLVGGNPTFPIYEINPDTGAVIRTIPTAGLLVSGLAFLNNEIFVFSDNSGTLTVLDYATGTVKRSLVVSGIAEALTSTGTSLLGSAGTTLYQIDPVTGALTTLGTLSNTTYSEGMGVIGNELFVGQTGTTNSISVYDLTTRLFKRSINGVNDLEGIGADNSGGGATTWTIDLNAGDSVGISTATPADGSGEFVNTLNPRLELLSPGGAVVASDDNSAPDGRNAVLSYNVLTSGRYTIRVVAASQTGAYTLTVSGATGTSSGFAVSGSIPANGVNLVAAPTTITIDLSDIVDPATVQASDLLISGVAAASVSFPDGDTLVFTPASPIVDGAHTLSIAAGAISSIQGASIAAFNSSFGLLSAPRVVNSSIQRDQVIATTAPTFTFDFNLGLQASNLDATDFTLASAGGLTRTVTSFNYDATLRRLTLVYPALTDDIWTLTLLSAAGRFTGTSGLLLDGETPSWPIPPNQSGDGTPGGNFVVRFAADVDVAPLPTPLVPVGSSSSMVYSSTVAGSIGSSGDIDRFTVTLDPRQKLTALITPAAGLQGMLEVVDSTGTVIASATAFEVGKPVVLQNIAIDVAGSYTLRVSSVGATSGTFTLKAYLNSAIESEHFGGAGNGSIATAQPLDGAKLQVGTPASNSWRAAVTGLTDIPAGGSGRDDFYAVNLAAGESLDVALTGVITALQILDASGQPLAAAVIGTSPSILSGWRPATAGTYFVKVTAAANGSYDLLLGGNLQLDRGATSTVPIGSQTSVLSTAGAGGLGRLYAFDAGGSRILELNPTTGATIRSFASPVAAGSGPDAGLATSSNAIIVGGNGSLLYELNPDTGATIRTINTGTSFTTSGLAVGNDEIYVLTDDTTTGDLRVLDYTTGVLKRTLTLAPAAYEALTVTKRGLLAFDGSSLSIVNVTTGVMTALGSIAYPEGLAAVGDELFSSSSTSVNVYDLATLALKRSYTVSMDCEGLGGDQGSTGSRDFTVSLTAGVSFSVQTSTPGDGSGEFVNNFNPLLQLRDASGALVASNSDGAPDGRNAVLNYTPTTSGTFTIRVAAETADVGLFVLSVTGNTSAVAPLTVTTITPANNATLAVKPAQVRVDFSEPIDLTSVSASDLTVDGVAATGFTVVDGNTLDFSLAGMSLVDGAHTIALAAGVVTSVSGAALTAFTSSFTLDLIAPKVVGINIQQGDIVGIGARTISLTFDRALAWSSLDATDFQLTGTQSGPRSPSTWNFNSTSNSLTINYAALAEDQWTLTLLSGNGRFESSVGNDLDGETPNWPIPPNQSGDGTAGGNFVVSFSTDANDTPLPVQSATTPQASMVAFGSTTGAIRALDDVDSYLLNLDSGQTLSLALTSVASLRLAADVLAPDGTTIYSQTAPAAGQALTVLDLPISQQGVYRLVLRSADSTVGGYTIQAALNAHYEAEQFGGPSNDTIGTAVDLDPSAMAFTSSAKRVAVIGALGTTSSVDCYRLTATAGDTLDLFATGSGLTRVSVIDPAGNTVAASTGTINQQTLGELVLNSSGVYTLVVLGVGTYQLTAARNLLIDLNQSNGSSRLGLRTGAIGYTTSGNSYYIDATAGELLRAETFTPAVGSGDFVNNFNPRLELYNPSGTLISVNDNGSPDGRNAILSEYVPTTGRYTLRVFYSPTATSAGYYAVVTSRTTGGAVTPFAVSSTTPAAGAAIADPAFNTYTVNFNDLINFGSLSASDITFNGVAALAYNVVDGDTATFSVPSPTDGPYTVAIAAGAITDIQGTPIDAFSSTFTLEFFGPRVVNSTVQDGDTRGTAATHALSFQFDKGLLSSNLESTDFTLVGATYGSYTGTVTYSAATRQVTLTFGNLPEDSYTLTLLSADGRFESATGLNLDGEATAWPIPPNRSGDGVAGGNFVVRFTVDANDVPILFTHSPFRESLVHTAVSPGLIGNAADIDSFTLDLDRNQFVTLALDASPGLRGMIELLDSTGAVLSTAAAPSAGADVVLKSGTLGAGTYRVRVSSLAGTSGSFVLRTTLNADVERALYGAPRNDSIASAQPISSSVLTLGSKTRRGAVVGSLPASALVDTFRDSFESGSLGSEWTTYSSITGGQTVVSSARGAGQGTYAMLMDTTAGALTLNVAELTVDLTSLAGRTGVVFSFAHFDFADEDTLLPTGSWTGYSFADGVSFSGDGGTTWRALWNVTSAGTWTNFQVDLSSAMSAAGWTFGPNFKIRLQQYDDLAISSGDGRGWDNIAISVTAPSDRYYSIDLASGTKFSVAADVPSGSVLQILDASANVLGTGVAGGTNVDLLATADITAAGTYYVRTAGPAGEYTLVTLEDTDIDREGNNAPASAMPLLPGTNALGTLVVGSSFAPGGTAFTGPRDFTGSPVSLGFSSNGSMIGSTIGARWNSTEMLLYGTYIGSYVASINGTAYVNNGANGAGSFAVQMYDQSAGPRHLIYMSGTITSGVTFQRWVQWNDGESFVEYWSSITNGTATPLANVALMDVRDVDVGATTTTANDVVAGGDLVYSIAGSGMGLGSADPRAVVSAEGFDNRAPFDIINSPVDPDGAAADIAINLAFNFGTVAPGETVSAGFHSVFGVTSTDLTTLYNSIAGRSAGPGDTADVYKIALTSGQAIDFATFTPGDGPGVFSNSLDPIVEVLDASGTVIASNDNGAPDNRNARLSFLAGATADYFVRVRPVSGSGNYVLETTVPLAVRNASIEYQNRRAFRLEFNAPVDPGSVSASDLVVTELSSGAIVVADRVEVSGTSVAWVFDTTPPDGNYSIALATGAVSGTGGQPLAATFTATDPSFYFLAADFDRDREVDFDDLLVLALSYNGTGQTFGQGNADYSSDGAVNFDDLLVLAARYGATLAPYSPPAP